MEDAKLVSLHETLKLLAPKGAHGGLGFYAAGGASARRTAADSMPEDKRMLYRHFVREGEGPSGHTHFEDATEEPKKKKKKKKASKLAAIDAAYEAACQRRAAAIDAAFEKAARKRRRRSEAGK